MTSVVCFSCQKTLTFPDIVGYREECETCRNDVHCCKNCDFYDPKAYNECRETSADVVREKDRNNFCDFFRPRTSGSSALDEKAKLKAAAEALFKKK